MAVRKYLGPYNDNDSLVPKSYADSLGGGGSTLYSYAAYDSTVYTESSSTSYVTKKTFTFTLSVDTVCNITVSWMARNTTVVNVDTYSAVDLDGTQVAEADVKVTSYTRYSYTILQGVKLAAGSHTISLKLKKPSSGGSVAKDFTALVLGNTSIQS